MRKGYFIRKLLDYLGVSLLFAFLYFLWLLYQGPLSVPFLKPYIVEALNSRQNEYRMDIGEVNIELIRSIQPIKIIAKNVSFRKNDDNVSIKTPKLFLSFSVRALLQGMIAPSSITIKSPTVSIFTTYGIEKNKENEINLKKMEYYVNSFEDFLKHFNSPEKDYPESYINSITVQNANIEFHEVDLGRKWVFSNTNLNFNRKFKNLELSAGGVVDLGERMATLGALIQFNSSKQELNLEFDFSDVVVSDFIKEIGSTISSIDVPIEGSVKAQIDFNEILNHTDDLTEAIDSAVQKVDFSLKGSAGKIEFAHDEHFDYLIDSFVFDGEINGGLDSIKLKKAELNMGKQKAELEFTTTGYKKYFLEQSLENLKINLKAKTNSLLMDDLARFWPRYFGEPAWEWCKDGLYGGAYKNADFEFEWSYDPKQKALDLSKLKGRANINDGTVFYLEGMPEVTNVYGTAVFDIGVIDITLDKGISSGVMLDSGRVRLYDLDKYNNYIDITINGNASLADVLRYIDNPPLEFAKDLGVDTNKISGYANIDLNLNFELYQDLKPEEIKVDVKAELTDVLIKNVINNKDLSSPKASLKVTQKGFDVEGDAFYDDIPIKFDFSQAFHNKNYQSKGRFELRVDESVKKKFGVDYALLSSPYMGGTADVIADLIIINDKKTQLNVTTNLLNTTLNYEFLGLSKEPNTKGSATAKLIFVNKKLQNIPAFNLEHSDFKMNGQATLNSDGSLKSVDIEKITAPKTDAKAKIEFFQKPQKMKINVTGNSYDLTDLFAKREKRQKDKALNKSPSDDDLENVPNIEIFIETNSLWTNPDTPIKNFIGSAVLKNGVGIEEAHIIGNHGTDKSIKLTLDYTPRPNGEYFLTIDSNNAGSSLRVLRLYENMMGGILKIEAKRGKDKKIIGHAKIRDFKISNTPLLAKLLTVASLSGMLDLLRGDGLVFSHFDAPFSYQNKTLQISDAKMFGNVIGFTGSGTINRATSEIDIKGIVSPAYSLNSMVGKIPLIGKVLAGKDGTIFAFDYDITQTIDDPKISISPLSILSPNSVKELFKE